MFTSTHWVETRTLAYQDCENAASWVADGNTSEDELRTILQGFEDCDPEVLDQFSPPNLSGEWADSRTPLSLAREVTGEDDPEPDDIEAIADCYEDAVGEAFDRAIVNNIRGWLGEN